MPGSGRSRSRPRRAAGSLPRPICRGSSRSASSRTRPAPNRRPGRRSPPTRSRYVGDAIAACIAPSRGEAEDLANAVSVDFEILDAVVDAPRDMRGSRHPVHEQWGDNLYIEHVLEGGDIDAAARAAEVTVTREFRMQRQSGAPLECRGVLAYRDHRLDEVVVYASTQTPHTVRVALAEILDHRGAPHPRRRSRCRRRVRAQGPALPGRDHPGGIGARARSPGALDRGPQRASADHGAYPRPPLQGHRLCRPAGPHSRRRRRDRRRCRRLRVVAAGAVSRSRHGGARPAGALHDPELPREALYGRDQQDAARPLSRGRPPGGVLCDRAAGRRDRPGGRARAERGADPQPGAARADAVHDDRRHAPRQRRLCGERAAVRRAAGPAGDPRAPAAGRAGWQADRHRLCHLCRADRARRRRIRRPRRLDHPGVRELHRAHPDRRQRRA